MWRGEEFRAFTNLLAGIRNRCPGWLFETWYVRQQHLENKVNFMAQLDAPTSSLPTESDTHHYDGAVGGWGSLKGLSAVVLREKPHTLTLGEELLRQNKHGGFMCVSCAWSKPAEPNPAEFCENGAKATAWT